MDNENIQDILGMVLNRRLKPLHIAAQEIENLTTSSRMFPNASFKSNPPNDQSEPRYKNKKLELESIARKVKALRTEVETLMENRSGSNRQPDHRDETRNK